MNRNAAFAPHRRASYACWPCLIDSEKALPKRLFADDPQLGMPHSRPLPSIGAGCHELRVRDQGQNWRIVYRIDADAIVIAGVFAKATRQTPGRLIDTYQRRLAAYDRAIASGG